MKRLPEFDKYEYYLNAVQSPDEDANFLKSTYLEIKEKTPAVLREDFCAAYALCCEWVKNNEDGTAIGIDLDSEPLDYGKQHYFSKLSPNQKDRLTILKKNVMEKDLPKADIIAALNFSYFGFKKRNELKDYFKKCLIDLKDDGLLFLDCFGGSACMEPNEHETEHDNFSYYWDQDSYNPITNEAKFSIHFKRDGEQKRREVFTYDWRLWSIAELKDLLEEVGFKKSYVYWEGTDEDGDGNGVFSQTQVGEECESWVAYIVGEK